MTRLLFATVAAISLAAALPAAAQQSPAGHSGMPSAAQSGNMNGSMGRSAQDWSKDEIQQIQKALNEKGFNVGEVDGVLGPQTKKALSDFQQKQGMQATGEVDSKTMTALGLSARNTTGQGQAQPSTMGQGSSGFEHHVAASKSERFDRAGHVRQPTHERLPKSKPLVDDLTPGRRTARLRAPPSGSRSLSRRCAVRVDIRRIAAAEPGVAGINEMLHHRISDLARCSSRLSLEFADELSATAVEDAVSGIERRIRSAHPALFARVCRSSKPHRAPQSAPALLRALGWFSRRSGYARRHYGRDAVTERTTLRSRHSGGGPQEKGK